jgi:hypothetical protein
MTVHDAIRIAEALLPGEPVAAGEDPRWQAMLVVEDFIETDPQPIWLFIARWGGHPQEDLRNAIACCLLEHLLECHFAEFFPQVEERSLADPLFADMFLRCWQLGQAEEPGNAGRFESLRHRIQAQAGA